MNIVITSESVWQLFLGLGGVGIVWMVLKWVGIRLYRWWGTDTVEEQIKKVNRQLCDRHRRSVETQITPTDVSLYWKQFNAAGVQVGCGQFGARHHHGVKNAAKVKLCMLRDYCRALDVEAM